jgi:hypothetical protein
VDAQEQLVIPPLRGLLAAGLVLTIGGVVASIFRIEQYLETPFALDSTSGIMAFYTESLFGPPDTTTVAQYLPFAFGIEPTATIAGLAIVVATLALAAALRDVTKTSP